MRNLLFLLTFSIVFLISSTVHAQSNKHLSTLGVDIWPEYDQPAVLTIYRITLAPNTVLPASLDLRLPSNAQINAVALVDPVKGLVNTPYDSSVQGKWSLLKVSTNFLQVQVEYYTPLVKNGSERHIVYEWAGDYAVDNLEVNFLRPFNADSVSISYTPVNTYPGQDGLTNYHIQKVDLAANQNFTL
jgi:hypothetical protein